MYVSLYCILFAGFAAHSCQSDNTNTVVLVQVFFRHGARTPATIDLYPNDPYKLDAFLPMGYGELTLEGKRQEYKLGKMLRKRYNSFLGDIFYTDMVYAQSTDYSRTKMSAQLVLAGLFPPAPSQVWDDELVWQPIPVAYEKYDKDYVFRRPAFFCPKYAREYENALQSKEAQSFLKHHKESLEHISKHTGREYKTIENGFGLYQTLKAESSMNLTLPEWTKRIFPEIITEFAIKRGDLENLTPSMRRLNGGRLLKQAVKNIVDRSIRPSGRKMYLFSGHDYFIVNILKVLDLYEHHFPKYSSAVIIELHYLADKNNYAVKILHSKSREEEIEEKQLDGCEILCPLNIFLNITKNRIPGNYTAECGSTVHLDS